MVTRPNQGSNSDTWGTDLNNWLDGIRGTSDYFDGVQNPFYSSESWYNLTASSILGLRAALSAADTSRVKIFAMGHSMLAGSGATSVGKDDAVAIFKRNLVGKGAPVRGAFGYLANNTNLDSRWTLTGTWTRPDGVTLNEVVNAMAVSNAAGDTATFTPELPGTIVQVHTYGNSAAFTVYIDDVLAGSFTPTGAQAAASVIYSGLSNSIHKVRIVASAGSVYLVGVNVYNTTGIEVYNFGKASSTAASWVGASDGGVFYANRPSALGVGTPNITLIQLDTNEVLWTTTTAAQYTTQMQSLITELQGLGSQIILIASPSANPGGNGYPAVSQSLWESFLQAEYALSDQFNIPLLDLTNLFVSSASAQSKGIMYDQIHPNSVGYGIMGRTLGRLFAAASIDYQSRNEITVASEHSVTTPASPANGLTLFSRYRARRVPAFIGPTGLDSQLQPALFSNRVARINAVDNITTPSLDGIAVIHLNNATTTPAAIANAGTNFYTSMVRYRCATTATAGTGAGTRSSTAQWMLSSTANKGGFFFVSRFGFNVLSATSRCFVGLSATTTALAPTTDPSAFLNQLGFGFDAADSNLQFMCNNAAGVSTKVDMGSNFAKVASAATNFFEVRVFVPSGNPGIVYYSAQRLNDGVVVNSSLSTTDVPANDTLLAAHIHLSNGTTAAAHSIDIQSLYIETDN